MTNRWFLLSLVLLVAAAAASLAVWLNREAWLPEQIPTHWGFNGPDRWTARDAIFGQLWIMPPVIAGMILLGRVIPYLSPENFKVDTFRPTFEYIFFLVALMMTYMHAVILLAYMGQIGDIGRWMMGGMLIVFAGMGNVLGKVQKNFYVGIRTPWTLASDAVWIGTHRMAAWTFVGGSVIGLVLLLTPVHPLASIAVLVVMALAPVFYSLWLYKRLEARGQLEKPAA